jgi:cytochrome c oxidase cbb3-type subunit IV
MDLELARSIVTVAAFITFLGIVVWAWSGARRARFEAAARLPLEDAEAEANAITAGPGRESGESRRA